MPVAVMSMWLGPTSFVTLQPQRCAPMTIWPTADRRSKQPMVQRYLAPFIITPRIPSHCNEQIDSLECRIVRNDVNSTQAVTPALQKPKR